MSRVASQAKHRVDRSTLIRPVASPIELAGSSNHCVLMVHGFGDTPQTLHYLAAKMHAMGYRVSVPLLPGHGTTPEEFFVSTAEEWVFAARARLVQLRERSRSVSLVGLSMGAAIAAILAAEFADIPALVLLSPYLVVPRFLRAIASMHRVVDPIFGPLNARHPDSIRDPDERKKNVGYGVVTAGALRQLCRVVNRATADLSKVRSPTLLIQSVDDPRIAPDVGVKTLAQLGSVEKQLLGIGGAGHIIPVDYGRGRVISETAAWISDHAGDLPPRESEAAH